MIGIFDRAIDSLSPQAMMQGGIGLLMTVLIVTIPPIATSYFQGTLGNFMSYSAFAAKEPGKDRNIESTATTQRIESETKASSSQVQHHSGRDGSEPIINQDRIKDSPRQDGANR